ncbi:hypothetical protein [Noviherbaspirillum saxi]|uniref:hypothetical protein n=1 Tax=Noviherbaspirillum saxi TaxID=2320863 RepID=UPI000E6CFE19|nr:hypothetical protein [Noviherbaspirillum saxi]
MPALTGNVKNEIDAFFLTGKAQGGSIAVLLTTSATQEGGSAPPEKDVISCRAMGWDWYYAKAVADAMPMACAATACAGHRRSMPNSTRPVVTLHMLGDMYATFHMEQIYRKRAIEKDGHFAGATRDPGRLERFSSCGTDRGVQGNDGG